MKIDVSLAVRGPVFRISLDFPPPMDRFLSVLKR